MTCAAAYWPEQQSERPCARAPEADGRPAAPERGLLYLGRVGRGKTHLVDTFYDSLALERKLRVHFHRFMQRRARGTDPTQRRQKPA